MPGLNDAQTIERGRYVATASDCVACHTTKDSKPFVGGVPFHTPIGTVFSTNITPDPKTGIGSTRSQTSTGLCATVSVRMAFQSFRQCHTHPTPT